MVGKVVVFTSGWRLDIQREWVIHRAELSSLQGDQLHQDPRGMWHRFISWEHLHPQRASHSLDPMSPPSLLKAQVFFLHSLMKLKHVVSSLVAMLPSLALPYTPYLSCLLPLEIAFLTPYSCENGLHCLNHPPFPSFVCSGPKNARSLVIGDPNLTCSWFINVGVVLLTFLQEGSFVSVPSLLSKTLESVLSYIPSSLPRRKRVPPMVYSKVEETDYLRNAEVIEGKDQSDLIKDVQDIRGLVIDGSSDLSGDDSAKRR
ncbi:hypothetical protein H5410_056573, partial [Solanum commersonii]